MKRLTLFLMLFSIGFMSFAQLQKGSEQTRATATTDFTATDLSGNTYHFFELLDAGKYVYAWFGYIG